MKIIVSDCDHVNLNEETAVFEAAGLSFELKQCHTEDDLIRECKGGEIFINGEITGEYNHNLIDTPNHHLYDKLRYDSDVEKNFAEELDKSDAVEVYVKLPKKFYIDTPMGHYNPDWAVLMEFNGDKRLYFVFETKGNIGNNRPSEEFKIECGRRHFKALDTGIKYEVKTNLKDVVLEEDELFLD